MKIFEFQFNPKTRKDRFFRVFSFEASPDQGSMYIVAELANVLSQKDAFLDRLATLLKEECYRFDKPDQPARQRLKRALKKANAFLAEETKNENVGWIGNLHLLLLLLVPANTGYTLYFTKTGTMEFWIARSGSLGDAGKNIETAQKDEGSVKVFGSVGAGKMIAGDRIIALTQEAFNFFSKENFLQTIVQLQEERQFQHIFKSKKKEIDQISGILFLVLVEPVRAPETNPSNRRFNFLLPSIPQLPKPRLSLPSSLVAKKQLSLFIASEAKKGMGLLLFLLVVLLIGFAVWGHRQAGVEEVEETEIQEQLTEEVRAQYSIVDVEAPEVASEFARSPAAQEAQRMIQASSKFYFFGPSLASIFVFDGETNTSETLNAGNRVNFGASDGSSVLFLAEPNILVFFEEQNRVVQQVISGLPEDIHIAAFARFGGNAYLLDAQNGEIFKFPIISAERVLAERWITPSSFRKPIGALSMAIDGSIWILKEDNEIQRYFLGQWEETLELDIVPALKTATMLKTSSQLPYLYVLDSAGKRLVILRKTGELVRQYRGEAFAGARDFSISPDGQTLYVFGGEKLYRISLAGS